MFFARNRGFKHLTHTVIMKNHPKFNPDDEDAWPPILACLLRGLEVSMDAGGLEILGFSIVFSMFFLWFLNFLLLYYLKNELFHYFLCGSIVFVVTTWRRDTVIC